MGTRAASKLGSKLGSKSGFNNVLDVLIPVRCGGCGSLRASPCRSCVASLVRCDFAPPVPIGATSLTVPFVFDGVARQLVTSLKYRGCRATATFLAGQMAASISPSVVARLHSVTWAPTSLSRRRTRGFDQAELLANEVAMLLGIQASRLLLHGQLGGSQTGRSRVERTSRVEDGMFRVASGFRQHLGEVLLVDDVTTTGATLRCAAQALRVGGAVGVHAVVAAATPARHGHPTRLPGPVQLR